MPPATSAKTHAPVEARRPEGWIFGAGGPMRRPRIGEGPRRAGRPPSGGGTPSRREVPIVVAEDRLPDSALFRREIVPGGGRALPAEPGDRGRPRVARG